MSIIEQIEQEVKEKITLRETWVQWITPIEWDWFATLTFKDNKSTYSAKKYLYKWLRCVNRGIWGRKVNHEDISVSWVSTQEYQQRGTIHYHLLIANCDALMRNEYAKKWYEISGGYAKVERARRGAAINYLTKYVLKDKDAELDIELRNIDGQRADTLDPLAIQRQAEGEDTCRSVIPRQLSLPLVAN